jgi:type 1 glutamine amidotransferase
MKVLVTRHSEGWEHSFLPHMEVAIKKMGDESGLFSTVTTARSRLISAKELANYDVIVMATTGNLGWTDEQKQALLDFVRGGKGFVGIHNATDTYYDWPEYGEMVGGWFAGHPWTQEVKINVEDTKHVLMSLDNSSVDLAKGNREDHDYAMGWCHEYGKGRVMYTALGHPDALWDQPWFLDHILACIKWAARLV